MKLIRKRVPTTNNNCGIILASKEELEILYAIVNKAELHTPKLPSTSILLGRIKGMRVTIGKALGQWNDLPFIDKI